MTADADVIVGLVDRLGEVDELPGLLVQSALEPAAEVEPLGHLATGDVINLVASTLADDPPTPSYAALPEIRTLHLRALEQLLVRLTDFDGTWRQRWAAFEKQSTAQPWWTELVTPGTKPAHNGYFNRVLGQLVRHDLVRPSHQWVHGKLLYFQGSLPAWRDSTAAAQLAERFSMMGSSPVVVQTATWLLGSICANTGRSPREVSSEEIVRVRDLLKSINNKAKCANTLWTAMHALGWFGDIPPVMPQPTRRLGRRTIEQHVDHYKISSPQREVLIEYLKTRFTTMDYSSFRNLVRFLVGNFWEDIATHHPELPDFSLQPAQVEAWKDRLTIRRDGGSRRDVFPIMIAVRAFYLDMADWALTDSYWAQWVTSCPINKHETRNLKKKYYKATAARVQQRTRDLAPLLPALVKGAEEYRRATSANLEAAIAAGVGGRIVIDGVEWKVRSVHSRHSVRAYANGKARFLAREEDRGFWTWAFIEVLRHSGIRMEEMLELTHLAVQPYTVKPTGETIPLVHIPPSKTDEERLIVASPELVHVLTSILSRIRNREQQVPLTQR